MSGGAELLWTRRLTEAVQAAGAGAASTQAAVLDTPAEFFTARDVLLLVLFLGLAWLAGKAAAAARLPALVGELLVGALCGPQLGNWVPQPAAVALCGQLGLLLLVVESGLEVQVGMLRTVGARGLAIAIVGSVGGTFLIAFGLARGVARLSVTEALAVGASLSPTSMGVSVILFKQWRVLNTPTAQTVLAAAVLDDIIGLVLLSELNALRAPSAAAFAVPIASAVGFLLGIGAAALLLVPPLLSRVVLPRVPVAHAESTVAVLLFGTVAGLMAALTAGQASYLLGAFLGGLSFSSLEGLRRVWHAQVKRPQAWLLRLFFAATIGFVVPIAHFWTPRVWALGLLFSVATLGKVITGALAPRPLNRMTAATIGAAMAARGEFAFLVANTSFAQGTMSAQTHAAVMLAIMLSLVGAPVALRLVLAAQARAADAALAAAATAPRARVYYRLTLRALERWGLVPDVLRALGAAGVDVLECRVDAAGPYQLLEAFLQDARLLDDTPSDRHAEGLRERQRALRAALLALLHHDEDARDESASVTGDGDDAGTAAVRVLVDGASEAAGAAAASQPASAPAPAQRGGAATSAGEGEDDVDVAALHGLRLERWMPGPSSDEWRTVGLVGNEHLAMLAMRRAARLGSGRAALGTRQAGAEVEMTAAGRLTERRLSHGTPGARRAMPRSTSLAAAMSDAAEVDAVLASAAAVSALEREDEAEANAGLAGRLRRTRTAGPAYYQRADTLLALRGLPGAAHRDGARPSQG